MFCLKPLFKCEIVTTVQVETLNYTCVARSETNTIISIPKPLFCVFLNCYKLNI